MLAQFSVNLSTSQSILSSSASKIDHVAIAVRDIESAIAFYTGILGMKLSERRVTAGVKTGMKSAVVTGGPVTFVLTQGTSSESQVSRFIEKYGQGVQHVAIEVKNLNTVVEDLKSRGMEFATGIIASEGLKQIFSVRDPSSGVMFELIQHTPKCSDFCTENVNQLFLQLEASDHF